MLERKKSYSCYRHPQWFLNRSEMNDHRDLRFGNGNSRSLLNPAFWNIRLKRDVSVHTAMRNGALATTGFDPTKRPALYPNNGIP
jgi:hypothetical protein